MEFDRRRLLGGLAWWGAVAALAALVGFAFLYSPGAPSTAAGDGTNAVATPTVASAPSSTSTSLAAEDTPSTVTEAPPPTEPPDPLRAPSAVKVRLYNGSNVGGAAVRTGGRLEDVGYTLLPPGESTTPGPDTAVFHRAGFDGEAGAVADALGLPRSVVALLPDPPPVGKVGTADVVVIVGNDIAGG